MTKDASLALMRAVTCSVYGPPQTLKLEQVERPELADDEVRIRTHVAGVNFPDTLIIKGEYQLKPPMPFIPGFEIAGEIIEVGKKATRLPLGLRVMALTSKGYGAFAEEVTARATEVVAIPDSLDYETATALYVAYGTAYHALVQRANLQRGETLVVLGAAGGVGLAAVELGKALGAEVIAVSRNRSRSDTAIEKGADHVIGYADEDVRARVLEITSGRGADVCIDMLGGQPFQALSRAMNWNGRLLIVGFTTGEIPKVSVNLPLLKGYQIVGVYWGAFLVRQPQINAENFKNLARLIEEGKVKPHIARRYSLEHVPSALDDLLSREIIGKLLITVL